MAKLIGCEECGRHVRASESACPFCGAARVASDDRCAPAEAAASPVVSRARMMGFGVAVGAAAIATAALTTGCPAYGAPSPDPEPDASVADSGGSGDDDGGGPVPAYGAPVP